MNLAQEFAEDETNGLELHLERGLLLSGGQPLIIRIQKQRIIPSNRIPARFKRSKVATLVANTDQDTPAQLLRQLADIFDQGEVETRDGQPQ